MNHIHNIYRTVPLVALLLFVALPATAAVPVPLKGMFEGAETGITEFPTRHVTGEVAGNASHLGRFTMYYNHVIQLPTLSGVGTSELVAANGDRIFADVIGQASVVEPGHLFIVETHTITGGNGHFEGASGSFILLRSLVQTTGATAGSFEGTLHLAGAQGEVEEWLQAVRKATARFHSKTQALKAGYEPDDHCVSVPGLGGMGYHWLNPSLVDDVYDPLEPEVVLYATGPGGQLKLVAIEYILVDVGQGRPSFAGHLFDVGGTPMPFPHYSLHVWLYEENPNGIFTPFNPNISCP